MRLRGLVRKELLQILRDPSSIAIALRHAGGAAAAVRLRRLARRRARPDRASSSRCRAPTRADFVASFRRLALFLAGARCRAWREAEQTSADRQGGRASCGCAADFAERLRRPDGAPIQVIVNGVERQQRAPRPGLCPGRLGELARSSGAAEQGEVARRRRSSCEQRVWFNSELRSRNFLVPGLIAVIMTLIGALLTALVMAREWERGTMEALLVTPVTARASCCWAS